MSRGDNNIDIGHLELHRDEMHQRIEISMGAVICAEAELRGEFPIVIGEDCVLHPFARVEATGGPIFLGKGNVLEEQCVLRNEGLPQGMHVGDHNLFEVRCFVENVQKMGDANVVEVNAKLDNLAGVGSDCIFGVNIQLSGKSGSQLSSSSSVRSVVAAPPGGPATAISNVFVSDGLVFPTNAVHEPIAVPRTTGIEREDRNHLRLIQILKETLPKYHYLKQDKDLCDVG
ncbi:unnamed protein product [Amoebophrya sp. A120]|nr:unnamed protein product [Amoebophrya sp. A120]|eukprot:GSA120T00015202001.1